jgi:hypothetical protein
MFQLAKVEQEGSRRCSSYTWFGAVTPRFDSGLVAGGKPRPPTTRSRSGSTTASGSPAQVGQDDVRDRSVVTAAIAVDPHARDSELARGLDVDHPGVRGVHPGAAAALG